MLALLNSTALAGILLPACMYVCNECACSSTTSVHNPHFSLSCSLAYCITQCSANPATRKARIYSETDSSPVKKARRQKETEEHGREILGGESRERRNAQR